MVANLARVVPWLLAALLLAPPALGRELAVAPERMVVVELATVAVLAGSGMPVVLLREPESGELVPIFIGVAEARAILFALRGVETPRPMTHDLLHEVIGKLDGSLERVVVDAIQNNTYHAVLEVRVQPSNRIVHIDARPSDALALAVRAGSEIRVAVAVLQAGRDLAFEGIGRDEVVSALGVTVVEATPELREVLALPDRPGVLVTGARGVAAYSGIAPGTLIVEVNGEAPNTPMAFLVLVSRTPSGHPAVIRYWRDGEEHGLKLPTDVPESEARERLAL